MKNRLVNRLVSVMAALAVTSVCSISGWASEVQTMDTDIVNPVIEGISAEELYAAMMYNAEVEFFNRAVFLGDSVMVGLGNYTKSHPTSVLSNTNFLTATSFSAWHAIRGIEKDKFQPKYNGVKMSVWDSIAQMDVDRVFMMFGTNDLIMADVNKTANNIIGVSDKIAAAKPGVEIHIISMTPVYSTTNKNALNNTNIPMLDEQLKLLCAERGYHYVDLYSSLVGADGALIPSFCSDKYVHHNMKAYSVWDKVLATHAATCLGDGSSVLRSVPLS